MCWLLTPDVLRNRAWQTLWQRWQRTIVISGCLKLRAAQNQNLEFHVYLALGNIRHEILKAKTLRELPCNL